jgi:hypothetical protein
MEDMTGVIGKKVIRSTTNAGEPAKQYFYIYKSQGTDISLIIRKLVLSSDSELYADFENLKTYKGLTLYRQRFSIKLKTLGEIVGWINELNENAKPKN